jgi:hypothetical protein
MYKNRIFLPCGGARVVDIMIGGIVVRILFEV